MSIRKKRGFFSIVLLLLTGNFFFFFASFCFILFYFGVNDCEDVMKRMISVLVILTFLWDCIRIYRESNGILFSLLLISFTKGVLGNFGWDANDWWNLSFALEGRSDEGKCISAKMTEKPLLNFRVFTCGRVCLAYSSRYFCFFFCFWWQKLLNKDSVIFRIFRV